jgi:hypothetical protein
MPRPSVSIAFCAHSRANLRHLGGRHGGVLLLPGGRARRWTSIVVARQARSPGRPPRRTAYCASIRSSTVVTTRSPMRRDRARRYARRSTVPLGLSKRGKARRARVSSRRRHTGSTAGQGRRAPDSTGPGLRRRSGAPSVPLGIATCTPCGVEVPRASTSRFRKCFSGMPLEVTSHEISCPSAITCRLRCPQRG